MRAGAGPSRARTAAGGVLLLLVALTVAALGAPEARGVGPGGVGPGPGDVRVDLLSIGPAVLEPGTELTVQAVVHNDGKTPLAAPRIRLKLAPRLLASRADVGRWATRGATEYSGSRVAETVLTDPIPPGGSVQARLSLRADDLGLPAAATSWGPRGIAIAVLDDTFTQVALLRSHVVWLPGRSFDAPLGLTVLVPLTASAPDVLSGEVPVDRLEALTSSGGRLERVLAATAVPGVTWALDPAVLTDPAAGAVTPQAAAAAGSASLARWQGALDRATAGHDVLLLPRGDPDVAAVAHAGQADLYELAVSQARELAAAALPAARVTSLTWPVTTAADERTLAMLAAGDPTVLVLPDEAQPPVDDPGYTPSGRSDVPTGGRKLPGLLTDTTLSSTLASLGHTGGGAGSTETGSAGTGPADVLAVQRLLAETAATTMERPSLERHLLVAAPRDWDPDPAVATQALAALTAVPWVDARPLTDLLGSARPDIERTLVTDTGAGAGELDADVLDDAAAALAATRAMAPALSEPADVVTAAERSAVAATALGWRTDERRWIVQVGRLLESATALTQAVTVVPGSAINVLSARADLPITLENSLDQDVTVRLELRPSSARLVTTDPGPVTLAASSQRRVLVPVHAVASGNLDVRVLTRTPAGHPVGTPVTLTVRVRADWENRGTAVIAAGAALVVVVGVVRSIRRGRRQGRPGAEPGAP